MQGQNFFIDDNRVPRGFNIDRFRRFMEGELSQQQKEREQIQQSLHNWQEKYRAEEIKLIGSEVREKLNNYVITNRRPEPNPEEEPRLVAIGLLAEERRQQRLQSLRFAQGINLDITGLMQLRRAASREFEQLIKLPSSNNKVIIEEPDKEFNYQPFPLQQANQVVPMMATFLPQYSGWWDRGADSYQSGDGQAIRNDSYLWSEASRSGSCVWSKNKSASNLDYLVAYRENGFLVPYQTTQNGILKIVFDIECSFAQHFIHTGDEFGWSEYYARTNEMAVVSVFWNWEDVNPATESADVYFVWGLDSSGDGESSPGIVYPVPAAQERTLTVYTNVSFPAGVTLWIYVGTQQRFSATVNDVSINTFVNSGWYIKRIQVNNV